VEFQVNKVQRENKDHLVTEEYKEQRVSLAKMESPEHQGHRDLQELGDLPVHVDKMANLVSQVNGDPLVNLAFKENEENVAILEQRD
jgi:hypothetical protein